jgi:hypothetical protein
MSPSRSGILVCSSASMLLAAPRGQPIQTWNAAMTCDQIAAEITRRDAAAHLAECRASELRPGYAYAAARWSQSSVAFLGSPIR